jgi:hypothetical protein
VGDHVEVDNLPQSWPRERDERPGVPGAGVRDDQADVEVVGRLGDGVEDSVLPEVDGDAVRLDVVPGRERRGDVFQPFLSTREEDDVDPVGSRLARELVRCPRRRR